MGCCVLCQRRHRKGTRGNGGRTKASWFKIHHHVFFLIQTLIWPLSLTFQYLRRRECEYDIESHLDFYRVSSFWFSPFRYFFLQHFLILPWQMNCASGRRDFWASCNRSPNVWFLAWFLEYLPHLKIFTKLTNCINFFLFLSDFYQPWTKRPTSITWDLLPWLKWQGDIK